PNDIALAPPPVVNFLARAPIQPNHLRSRIASRTFGSHFVQSHHPTSLPRLQIHGLFHPLFRASTGSTRSPNQVSCVRHRTPSFRKISSIRLRFIPMPLTSLRYVSSRSSVQLAKGRFSICGSVSDKATTSLTSSEVYVGGRPARGSSFRP